MKYHKGTDKEYRSGREVAYQRENRKKYDRTEYRRRYYLKHREEIIKKVTENYDTKKNTARCKKYRQKHLEQRQAYERRYYEEHKEQKKIQARERYYRKKYENSEKE